MTDQMEKTRGSATGLLLISLHTTLLHLLQRADSFQTPHTHTHLTTHGGLVLTIPQAVLCSLRFFLFFVVSSKPGSLGCHNSFLLSSSQSKFSWLFFLELPGHTFKPRGCETVVKSIVCGVKAQDTNGSSEEQWALA